MAYIRKNGGISSRSKGDNGEGVACKYLEKLGYTIVLRNYRKVWGELDIIASKDNVLHFVEVKSVTYWGTGDSEMDIHKPEDNVHGLKIRHIRRMVQTYLDEFNIGLDVVFQFHVLCVYMNMITRTAKVRMIGNIIL